MYSDVYSENFDPDRPAYVMANAGLTVSYGELEAVSNQIAHLFRDSGLQRGDSIALCLEKSSHLFPDMLGSSSIRHLLYRDQLPSAGTRSRIYRQ